MERTSAIECTLQPGPIEPLPRSRTRDGNVGAEVVFLGRTRPDQHPEYGELLALDYEAHDTLAINVMREICKELVEEFGLQSISLKHSVNQVPVGLASVELVISAPHRAEALAACAAGIDRLKERVPIWKRECWKGGRSWSKQTEALPHGEDS